MSASMCLPPGPATTCRYRVGDCCSISTTPERHCRSLRASARNANTSCGGRATTSRFDASGMTREQLLDLVETAFPAHLVGRRAVLGRVLAVRQEHLGALAEVAELDRHERLRLTRWRPALPSPRVRQPDGRLDLAVRAADDHRLARGRLHHQPVAAARSEVDVRLRAGELAWAPPSPQ